MSYISKIYIAAALSDVELVKLLFSILMKVSNKRWQLTYDWTEHGKVEETAKMPWLAYTELKAVREADVLGFVTPGGRGAHVELGAALGLNKPIVMYDKGMDDKYDYPCLFHEHPNIHKSPPDFESWAYLVETVSKLQNDEKINVTYSSPLSQIKLNNNSSHRYLY